MKQVAALLACACCIMAIGAAIPAAGMQQPSVSLTGPDMALVGQNISVQISVSELTDFNAASVTISYNASCLTIGAVENGSVNGTDVPTSASVHDGVLHIVNDMGLQPVNGSGSLATIWFTCTAAGHSDLDVGGNLSDGGGQEIPASWHGHRVTVAGTLLEVQAPETVQGAFDASLGVSNVTNLSSVNLDLHYDPVLLSFTGADDGSIDGTPVGVTLSQEDGIVHLVGRTNATGSGHVAVLHFSPRSEGALCYLNISNVTLSNTAAQEIPAYVRNVQVLLESTSPVAPTASFAWPPRVPVKNETVTFDASNSSDPDGNIVGYTWTFGDGASDTGPVVTHRYQATGNQTVTLTVTDNDGLTNTTTATLTIAGLPPTAHFSYTPAEPREGHPVEFTDQSSDDGDIVNWTWNYGDGTTAHEQHPTHVYEHAGTYTVALTVRDDSGATNTTRRDVTVTANNQPEQPSSPSPNDGASGVSTNVALQVSVADPDDDTMNVTFHDASDDDIIDTISGVDSGGTASVTWSDLGYAATYSWYAVADDGRNATVSPTWQFTTESMPVNEPPGQPSNPAPNDGASGTARTVTLQVTVTDPDGDSMDVRFYTGAGSIIAVDSDIASGGTASVTWSGLSYAATYSWYAVADDGNASTNSSIWSFTVRQEPTPPPPQPEPPSAAFTYSMDGRTVTFTDQSSDPDGSITAWQWSYGDGATASQENPSHSYSEDGTYTVTLSVTDDDGMTDETSTEISVAAPQPQQPDLTIAVLSMTPASPDAGDTVQVTVTVANNGTGNADQTLLDIIMNNTVIASVMLPAIEAGGQVERTQAINVTAGTHTLKADVDPNDDIHEQNEGNNQKTMQFSVPGKDGGGSNEPPWLIIGAAIAIIGAGAAIYLMFKRGMLS
jgi:PKD repeat protein